MLNNEVLKSKKIAIIISYISLSVNTLNNIILTPIYIKYLGLEQYGLYQMIYTIASYILVLDFGINTTMIRYISKFHVNNDYESEKDFSAHCLFLVGIISVAVVIVGGIINAFLLKIFPTITSDESQIAHKLFLLMLFVIIATLIERFLQGCVASYEQFVVFNSIGVIRLLVKLFLTIVFLIKGSGLVGIVLVDIIAISVSIILLLAFTCKGLHFKVKFAKFKKALVAEIFIFMLPVFLQSVIGYINTYVDKTILGIMTTKTDVAIYSISMTFVALFNALPSAISSVFLPEANKLIHGSECTKDKLTDFVIRPGRYQFIMCFGLIGGFFCFGKEFLYLWAGENAVQAWNIALVIMIPNAIPLVENTIISILDAMNKRLFRSLILFIISLFNVIISIILVSLYGMKGAPVGTAISFILGYGVILNIYYHKKIGIDVIKLFKSILSKLWICALVPVIVAIPLNCLSSEYSWKIFSLKCIMYIIVYVLVLLLFGFNDKEKKEVTGMLRRFVRFDA